MLATGNRYWYFPVWIVGFVHACTPPPQKKQQQQKNKPIQKGNSARIRLWSRQADAGENVSLQVRMLNNYELRRALPFTQLELLSWKNPTGWIPLSLTSLHPALNFYQTHKHKCGTVTWSWKTTYKSWLLTRISYFSQCRHHPSIKGNTNSIWAQKRKVSGSNPGGH